MPLFASLCVISQTSTGSTSHVMFLKFPDKRAQRRNNVFIGLGALLHSQIFGNSVKGGVSDRGQGAHASHLGTCLLRVVFGPGL